MIGALLAVIVFELMIWPLVFQFVMNGLLDRFDRMLRHHLYDTFGRKPGG